MLEREHYEIEKEILKKMIPLLVVISLVVSLVVGATIGIVGNSMANFSSLFSFSRNPEILNTDNVTLRVVSEESAVIDAVKKAGPAVVSIIISSDVPIVERYYEKVPFSDNLDPFGFFRDFTFTVPRYRQNGTEKQRIGAGTGFLVGDDGYILTNKHVVENESAEYTVITHDQKKFTGRVLARDPLNDIAVMKIESDVKFPFLELGDSENLQIGQTVIAIGYALGRFDNTVSKGVISGLYRTIDAFSGNGTQQSSEHLEGIIQTDAAINPGNSGGPLLNLAGQVIGMNVAIVQGSQNVGFTLPINDIKVVYNSVKEHGRIVRPMLGVRYLLIDEDIAKQKSLSVISGALIMRGEDVRELAVIPGSPADKAGLKENDIILEVDGVPVDRDHSLASLLRSKKVGDVTRLKVLREKEELLFEVLLEEMPNTGEE